MEVIGCAASVSQLLVYVSSSAVRLHRLCSELRHGNSAYRNEETNINLLLNILQRLSRQDIQDHNPVLPVLITISGIACQALHLLQPKKVFGINWTSLTSQDKIQSAFQSLDKQRRLLHLYISQAHHDALVDLRETIDRTSMASSSGSNPLTPPTSDGATSSSTAAGSTAATGASTSVPSTQATQSLRPTFKYSGRGAKTAGIVQHMNREELPDADINVDNSEVSRHGISMMGNQTRISDQTLVELAQVQQKGADPDVESEAAPQERVVETDGQTHTPQLLLEEHSRAEYTATAQLRFEKNKNKTLQAVRGRKK